MHTIGLGESAQSISPADPTVALVVSGGGVRLSFSAGALSFLYGVRGIRPTIIAGTSSGALLAGALAQAATSQGQAERLAASLGSLGGAPAMADVLRPTPLAAALAGHVDAGEAVDLARSLALLTRAAGSSTVDGRPGQSMYSVGPALRALVEPPLLDPEAVRASGVSLRVTMVCLETGALRLATETGALLDRTGRQVAPAGTAPLADAILASAAMPGILPPVEIGGLHYVDGGMREFLPLPGVLDEFEPDEVIAISTRPLGLERTGSFANRGILDVLSRCYGDIGADEQQVDEAARAADGRVRLIQSVRPLHPAFEMTPEAAALSVDDGWMASAAAFGESETGAAHAAEISALRVALARAEREAPDEADAARARLENALRSAPAGLLPPGAQHWAEPRDTARTTTTASA